MTKRKPNSLYKFKSSNYLNIKTLLENKLWVSNLYSFNDSMEFPFYVNEGEVSIKYTLDDLNQFQKELQEKVYCISVTKLFANERLWNYYTDGFKGFCLRYRYSDIVKTLDDNLISYIDNDIDYNNEEYNLSPLFDEWLKTKSISNIDLNMCFSKQKVWEEEQEYRIAMLNNNDLDGFTIDIIPREVIVGYRMEETLKEKIKDYCIDNDITFSIYQPKLDKKGYIREKIIKFSK